MCHNRSITPNTSLCHISTDTPLRVIRIALYNLTKLQFGMQCIITFYVTDICDLLGYYAESCSNCLPTFRDNVSVPSSRVGLLAREYGNDTLSRNVGNQLPHHAA
jgi:hypothetical protein